MKLSLIIPAYNVEQYIERCIESCEHQDMSHSDYEVIVVNDGSTDSTLQIVQQLADKYDNVIIRTQENQGQSGARNKALGMAKGEYVWFVDGDDYIVPDCLSILYSKAKENNLDALYFILQRHYEGEQEPVQQFECRQATLPTNEIMDGVNAVIKGYNPCSSCAAIFNLNKIKKENLRFIPRIFRQDTEFTYRSIPTFDRIMFLPNAYYVYFTHSGTVTTSDDKNIVVRRMIGDGYVARTCIDLAEKYKDNKKLSETFRNRYQGVMTGALFTIWHNRKGWKNRGITNEILDKYEELGIYPVKGPYKNWKHHLAHSLLLNHDCFMRK